MDKKIRWVFSVITGQVFSIEEDELKNLTEGQIPLKDKPGNCRKCYGRMHVGFEVYKKYYIICPRCARKYIDEAAIKDDNIVVHTPKTTNEMVFNENIPAA